MAAQLSPTTRQFLLCPFYHLALLVYLVLSCVPRFRYDTKMVYEGNGTQCVFLSHMNNDYIAVLPFLSYPSCSASAPPLSLSFFPHFPNGNFLVERMQFWLCELPLHQDGLLQWHVRRWRRQSLPQDHQVPHSFSLPCEFVAYII